MILSFLSSSSQLAKAGAKVNCRRLSEAVRSSPSAVTPHVHLTGGYSLHASFNSAYMILGIPSSEMNTYGTQFYLVILGTEIGVHMPYEIEGERRDSS